MRVNVGVSNATRINYLFKDKMWVKNFWCLFSPTIEWTQNKEEAEIFHGKRLQRLLNGIKELYEDRVTIFME